MKRSIYVSASANIASIIFCAMLCAGNAFSQLSLEGNLRMTGDGVTAVFEPQREVIQKCGAVLYNGREVVSYGIVVSPDGYILTKASEIETVKELSVRVDMQSFKKVKIAMVDPRWDVALVKIDAKGLVPAEYATSSKLDQGTWVVVNGATSRTRRRVLAGIISANPREIPAQGGAVLGVILESAKDSLVVKEVSEGSGAEEAGVQGGDTILSVDGEPMKNMEDLTKCISAKKAGAKVKMRVKRNKEEIELDVRLAARGELFEEVTRNDQMSGDYSKRRSGFPRIIQHDVLANSNTMGGPVLDLDGHVIGMNIARADRAQTFAIPVEELKELAEGMMSQVGK